MRGAGRQSRAGPEPRGRCAAPPPRPGAERGRATRSLPRARSRGRGAAAGLCPPSRCLRAELRAPRPSSAEKNPKRAARPTASAPVPSSQDVAAAAAAAGGVPALPESAGEAGRGDRVVPRRCPERRRGAPGGSWPGRTACPLLGPQPRCRLPDESAPGCRRCWSEAVCSPRMFSRNAPEAGRSWGLPRESSRITQI